MRFLSIGLWFTEAHIETAADDSTSCTLFGTKLYVAANPGPAYHVLYRNAKSLEDFIDLIKTGPREFHDQNFTIFTTWKFSRATIKSFSCCPYSLVAGSCDRI